MQPRSWSPDGTALAGSPTFYVSANSVTLVYSLASRRYTALPEGQGWPVWLPDSRRLLVGRHNRIVLLDTRTGRATPVLAAGGQGLSLSRDGRWASYIETRSDADVWMATLGR
jgi:hypothetical protein